MPAAGRLVWDPVHLTPRISDKGEIAVLIVQHAQGRLVTLAPQRARGHAEWGIPPDVDVVAVVLGPDGLNMAKVQRLLANNDELLAQLADYAQQTSQVEALIQGLSDAEASGSGTDAALRGFSSRFGVAMPKLDSTTGTDRQATALLAAVVPTANVYDPLAPASTQAMQTGGLAASVAGLFFGNGVGLAAGGTALVTNLTAMLFPNTEFRSAFAQAADPGVLEFCAKSQAGKARTRAAYLWAYRVPNQQPPVTALSGTNYVPAGAKSTVPLKTGEGQDAKVLMRARDWRLAPLAGGADVKVPVAMGSAANSLLLDLSDTKVAVGDYRLTASWDWDPLTLGTVHVRTYSDFRGAELTPESRDKLAQGSGVVAVTLRGADFDFVEKVELQKAAAKPGKSTVVRFELPAGPRKGLQTNMTVDIDTASAGEYKLQLEQADGVSHTIPLTVLPASPRVSNLPVRVNTGEAVEKLRLEGAGLDRVEAVTSDAGPIEGAGQKTAWSGKIRLRPEAQAGETFSVVLKIRGLEEPVTLKDAIEVVGPRPKIAQVRKSLAQDMGIETAGDELPAGTSVGLVMAVENLHDDGGARPRVELGCREGGLRKALTLAPDERADKATLSFAGPDSLYLAVDPATVGYPGCELTATVSVEPRGASDRLSLGRVVRIPLLERFTLTNESLGGNEYAGILRGRDLDVIEKAGWDAKNGLPVVGIPTPVAGDSTARQTLKIAVPWPSPAPHAPLYIWLRGETAGRRTSVAD
jgi:hypothetical protein